MTELNAMEELARASYYIQDALRGCPGEFKVEEEGWNEGDRPRAIQELHKCQIAFANGGWKRKPIPERFAPYNLHNVEVCCYYKQFEDERERWATIVITTRFGVDATIQVHDYQPWG